jgi:hypothetical protein
MRCGVAAMGTLRGKIVPPINGSVLSEKWRKRRGHEIALWTSLETDGVVFEVSYDEYWGVQSLKVAIEIEVGRRNPASHVKWI